MHTVKQERCIDYIYSINVIYLEESLKNKNKDNCLSRYTQKRRCESVIYSIMTACWDQ